MEARSVVFRARALFLLLVPVLAFLLAIYVRVGSTGDHSFFDIFQQLRQGPGADHSLNRIVWEIRLPRGLISAMVGALLGTVGCVFQALFRNPLAEPYIVGVSSGAAVGGALALVFGFGSAFYGLGSVGAGLIGGLVSLAVVFGLARRRGVVDVTSLLLAGVSVSALLSALLSFILLMAGHDTNRVLGFLLGHTSDATWHKVAVLVPTCALGLAILYRESRTLNALSMGEAAAGRLGVDVSTLTRKVLIVGTAMTAAAVGSVGIVGFVGLVAPHVSRKLFGVDWRVSLPGSALVGMVVMLVADLIAQRGLSMLMNSPGMEVNVGIVAAILGAPSLLILLRRSG